MTKRAAPSLVCCRSLAVGMTVLVVVCAVATFPGEAVGQNASVVPDETYSIGSLDPAIRGDSDAVMRLYERVFTVRDDASATEKIRRVITIFNSDGREEGEIVVFYDELVELKKVSGRVRDSEGNVVRKLGKEDQEDVSAISGYALYEDYRARIVRMFHGDYPYTVEFEYELKHNGLLGWPNWSPQWGGLPVERGRFVVDVPMGMPVRYAADGLDVEPSISRERGRDFYRWTVAGLAALELEPWGPSYEEQAPMLYTAPTRFSTEGVSGDMGSWGSFGSWYNTLSSGRDGLPPDAVASISRLMSGATTTAERARRVYEYLQDRTRYVSIQLGVGRWQPFSADYVHERSYGDCKALVNYMMALLKVAGVASYPALIRNGSPARDIQPDFPCNQFNHVVLLVPAESDSLWLECTSQVMPFGHIGASNEDRFALVITPEGGNLVRTPASSARDNTNEVRASVALSADGSGHAEVTARFTGNLQDRLRHQMANESDEERTDMMREQIDIPNFEIVSADFAGVDAREEAITLTLALRMFKYGSRTGTRLFFRPSLMNRRVPIPPESEERTQPAIVPGRPFAFSTADTVVYQLPPGFDVEALPDAVTLEERFGMFESRASLLEDGTVFHTRVLEMSGARIPADQFVALREFLKQVHRADKSRVVLVQSG